MKGPFADFRVALGARLPKETVTSLGDTDLAELYNIPITLDVPEVIELPDDNPYKWTTTVVKVPGMKGAISVPFGDLLKHTVRPSAELAASVVFKPDLTTIAFSIIDILQAIKKRVHAITKEQLAICRAVLLVMQAKKMHVLLEKGASVAEIRDTLTAQMDEVPDDLQSEVDELVKIKALEIEKSGEETFYKVPW